MARERAWVPTSDPDVSAMKGHEGRITVNRDPDVTRGGNYLVAVRDARDNLHTYPAGTWDEAERWAEPFARQAERGEGFLSRALAALGLARAADRQLDAEVRDHIDDARRVNARLDVTAELNDALDTALTRQAEREPDAEPSDLDGRLAFLEGQNDALAEKLDALAQQNRELCERNAQLVAHTNDLNAAGYDLRGEYDLLQDDFAALCVERDQATKHATDLANDLAFERENSEHLQGAKLSLLIERDELREKLAAVTLDSVLTRERDAAGQEEQAYAALADEYDAILEEVLTRNHVLESAAREVVDAWDRYAAAEYGDDASVQDVADSLNRMQAAAESLREHLPEAEREIEDEGEAETADLDGTSEFAGLRGHAQEDTDEAFDEIHSLRSGENAVGSAEAEDEAEDENEAA